MIPSTTDVFDINYDPKNYDWQNDTLVTLLGTLNDPVTANVVTSQILAKDFVFGDWGPKKHCGEELAKAKLQVLYHF